MNYTYQTTTESGSFSNPESHDVSHATSKRQLARAIERWADSHEDVGSDASYASLTVWKGTLDDVQDAYPDFQVTLGPRGGVRFESC